MSRSWGILFMGCTVLFTTIIQAQEGSFQNIDEFIVTSDGTGTAAGAGPAPRTYDPSRILVRFREGLPRTARQNRHAKPHFVAVRKEYTLVQGLESVEVQTGKVQEAIAAYQADPNVLYAEPDYIVSINDTIPNDPDFGLLWGLHNTGQAGSGEHCAPIGTPGADVRAAWAWNLWTGDPNFKIAVIGRVAQVL